MTTKLKGIVPPLITPLLDKNSLDIEGLENLLEHVIAGGVHGVFILGTTGEAPSLSIKLKVEMIQQSCKIAKKRIPVLVGISDTSIVESIQLSQVAFEAGADAVVSAPPYYFTTAQPELAEFYENLIPDLELPLYLYNMPSATKVHFEPQTVERIAQNEKVIGFKDSSANGTYFQSILHTIRNKESFSVFVGPEEMLASVVFMGADGGINGGANLFPTLYVNLYNAASNGDVAKARELQQEVMKISSTIYNVGSYGSSYLKGLKCSLSVLDICGDVMAHPFNRFDKSYRDKIIEAITNLKHLK